MRQAEAFLLHSLDFHPDIRRISNLFQWVTVSHNKDAQWVLLASILLNKGEVNHPRLGSILHKVEVRCLLLTNGDHNQMGLCYHHKDGCNLLTELQIPSNKVMGPRQMTVICLDQKLTALILLILCALIQVQAFVDRTVRQLKAISNTLQTRTWIHLNQRLQLAVCLRYPTIRMLYLITQCPSVLG